MEKIDPTSAIPKQEGAYCPSCGRYVGAYTTCPYCGAHIEERVSTKFLKIFALTFSILGVMILWWAAGHRMVPQIQAAEIDNRTNFAYAQMKGVVTRTPSYDEKNKSLSFPLDDGTGSVWVKAYGAQAEEIHNSGKIPKPGDTVSVEGTVRLKGDYTYITINLPEKLKIIPPKPIELDISEITDSLCNSVVKTAGIINSVRSYDTSMRLQLCSPNSDACIDATFYFSTFTELDPDQFQRGDTVALDAMVGTYKGKLKLVPRSPDELWHKKGEKPSRKWTSGKKPPADAPKIQIKNLKKDLIGKYVAVSGKITMAKQIKGGVLISMTDGTGSMTFPIWDRVLETVPNADAIRKGATISFIGKVGEYKGKMQVVPDYGPGVEVKYTKSTSTQTTRTSSKKAANAKLISLGDLSKDMIGQQVKVGGDIKKVKNIKGGILITIDDGTDEMTFPIWDKVKKHIENADAIVPGGKITLIGKVKEYKGRLEVVPSWGENVWVGKSAGETTSEKQAVQKSTSEKSKSSGEIIKLVELNEDMLGEIVTVQGEITKVKSIKGGTLITIRDGDEYMTTPLWNSALKNFDESKIVKGAKITLTGKVKKYKDRLEVVARNADDIVIE